MEHEQTALDLNPRRAYGSVHVDIYIDCPHDSLECACSNAFDELWGQVEDAILDGAHGAKLAELGATFWVR